MTHDALLFLLPPTLMCFVLVGIHCYLGIHVLERGVIFVDLALAQLAALGTTIAFVAGYDHDQSESYFISLACTLLAALFLSFANRHKKRLSQEALIGVMYAFGSAAVILLIDQMSHGSEHLKHAMVGQLLWVSWSDVIKVSLIYFVVALIHWFCRSQFFKATRGEDTHWGWDFLFYALFGIVITSSVHVAGVLLVFSFLIVPAMVSTLFVRDIKKRLAFGWCLGFLLSLVGMTLSYEWDLPPGAFIVVIFTLVPLLSVLLPKSLIAKN